MNNNSQAVLLTELYTGVLIDAECIYPQLAQSFERDLSRLLTIIKRNELWFFTLELPSWSKHLLKCIESGRFTPMSGPQSRPLKGHVFPKLFSGLMKAIFDEDGLVLRHVDTTALRFLLTLLNAAKKIRMKCSDRATIKAVQSFVDVEEIVRDYSLNWGSLVLDRNRRLTIVGDERSACEVEVGDLYEQPVATRAIPLSDRECIQSVADRIFSSFGSPFYTELLPKHGPGAISDRSFNRSKYQFHNWPEKLEECFPSSVFGVANAGLWSLPIRTDGLRFNPEPVASRLIAVPKTQKGPRLIAAEPVANMWMQQALRRFIEDGVDSTPLRNCIDFKNQSHSGKAALQASLTRSHSTIDLSDASDRLSLWLVERLVRSNADLLDAFNAVRTDVIDIVRSKDLAVPKGCPERIKLKKFSTQGSALTFPVQTVVYAIISIGTLLSQRNMKVTAGTIEWASREVRVFGDDIIVPNDVADNVIQSLEALGFLVNVNKTFQESNFRESCGVEAYQGVDVTPTYVLEPYSRSVPTSVVSLVECSNNFFKKGYVATAERLRKTLPDAIYKKIPFVGHESGAFGFLGYFGYEKQSNRSRMNAHTHLPEVEVLSVSSKTDKMEIDGDYALLQYFTENPEPTTKWEHGEARRPQVKLRLRWVPVERLV